MLKGNRDGAKINTNFKGFVYFILFFYTFKDVQTLYKLIQK